MRPQPIDEAFSDSYQSKGLQPTGLVQDDTVSKPPARDRYQAANDNEDPPRAANDEARSPSRRPISPSYTNALKQKYLTGAERSITDTITQSAALKVAAKAKVAGTNIGIYSWAFPVWFLIQLPLALMSLGFIGIAAGLEEVKNGDGISSYIASAASAIAGVAISATDTLFGTNLSELTDPTAYASAIMGIIFFLGIAKLMAIGLIYQFSFTHSLFGSGSAVKVSMFILALFGYFFPFFNLFPWFFAWTFAVALYPR